MLSPPSSPKCRTCKELAEVLADYKRCHKSKPLSSSQISAWIQHWNVGEEGRQTVLRLLYEAQYDCERCGDAAATMVRLLEGYSDDNAAQAREDAVR